MMKVKNLLLLWFSFTLVACTDELSVIPENSVTFKNLDSEKEIEALLYTAAYYCRAWHQSEEDARGVIYMNVADETSEWYWDDDLETEISFPHTPQWTDLYQIIAQVNIVLEHIDAVGLSPERYNYYKGQVAFYKAWMYFYLVQIWGDCILIRDEVEMLPIAKTRWPLVLDYAIEQARNAVELLPDFDQVTSSNGQVEKYKSTPCKGAAQALLAYLCAWKGGCGYFMRPEERDFDAGALWKQAEEACSYIIDSTNIYALAEDPEEVCTSVMVGDSRESIFEIIYKDFSQEVKFWGSYPLYQAWPLDPASSPDDIRYKDRRIYASTVREMYPGNDLRKYAYFYDFENMAKPEMLPTTGGFAYPYKGRQVLLATSGVFAGSIEGFNQNLIIWRLADIYLLRAECRVRLGDERGAISDLNKIRERANAIPYDVSEYDGDLRYAIFKEREKELFMEGHRYYDIVRNGYARKELKQAWKNATDQEYIDGAFFRAISSICFQGNPLLRQNIYWSRRM